VSCETRKKILLFGGTFDPVHNGHLIVSRAAAERLGAQKVIFIPSALPPHKVSLPVSDARDRLRIVQEAVRKEELFAVSDCELQRAGPSYTLDTVRYFRKVYGEQTELFWLIGADSVEELTGWYRVKELVNECTIVTAPRTEDVPKGLAVLPKVLNAEQIEHIRKYVLDTPRIDISATEIRRRVAQGRSISFLVPPAVEEYIFKQKLYQTEVAE